MISVLPSGKLMLLFRTVDNPEVLDPRQYWWLYRAKRNMWMIKSTLSSLLRRAPCTETSHKTHARQNDSDYAISLACLSCGRWVLEEGIQMSFGIVCNIIFFAQKSRIIIHNLAIPLFPLILGTTNIFPEYMRKHLETL